MTRPVFRARPGLTALEDRTTPAAFTPAQIRQAYGIDFRFSTAAGQVVAADGSGQTIAVIEAYHDPNIAGDLHAFDQRYGLPDPALAEVGQNLSTPTQLPAAPPADDPGWYSETALDVEWAHAAAPGAAILLVEASSTSISDMFAAVDMARRYAPPGLPPVSVVSMSFGTPSEYRGETADDSMYTTPAGHTGITFVAATGDDYGYGGYAAYSPNVLAVGGTHLTTDASGNWSAERPWRTVVGGQVQGSAGGYSQYEAEPGWQLGVQQTGKRGIPDVAYDADPATGFYVYDSGSDPNNPWSVVGGTSAGTPQWAGLIAVADQGRALSGRGPLDGPSQTLPYIYGLPDSAFHVLARTGEQPGWNIDTGRGSPVANQVVAGLLVGTGVSVVGTDVPLSPPTAGGVGSKTSPPPAAVPPTVPPAVPPATSPRSTGPAVFAAGSGDGGPPTVTVYAADGSVVVSFDAYEAEFTGGVRVSLADVTGDGQPDVVVAPGPGREPEVRVFNATTGALETAFLAFEPTFLGGVNLATGRITGRTAADVVVAADEGGGPRVRVMDAVTGQASADFYGIDDASFRGGARVATGDLNRDGVPDLIVAAGLGGGPRVAAYDGRSLNGGTPVRLFNDFYAFEDTLRNGVTVAAGDVNGDGYADVIVGGGPGGGPRVAVFDGRSLLGSQTVTVASFYAGDPTARGGVTVAAKDLDGDNRADVIVGSGPDGGDRVTAYLGANLTAGGTPNPTLDLSAFPGFSDGVYVG